jgi:hypothetical protein
LAALPPFSPPLRMGSFKFFVRDERARIDAALAENIFRHRLEVMRRRASAHEDVLELDEARLKYPAPCARRS